MRVRSLSRGLPSLVVTAALGMASACSSFSEGGAPQGDGGVEASNQEGGASPDGAAVADASAAETSTAGEVTVLASSLNDLTAVMATETTVYVVARTDRTIFEVSLSGGPLSKTLTADSTARPSSAALHGSTIFWADATNKQLLAKSLGAGLAVLAQTDGALTPVAVAAGADSTGAQRLLVVAIDALESGKLQQYGSDLSFVPTNGGTYQNPFDVALSGTATWLTERGTGAIWEGKLDAASSVARVSNETGCESIAADAQGVYWARPQDGLIRMMSLPVTASTVAETLAANQVSPHSITSDASGVYWMTSDGKLQRSARQPSELPPQTVAKGFAGAFTDRHVRAIALTSSYAVWITSDGKVLRVTK